MTFISFPAMLLAVGVYENFFEDFFKKKFGGSSKLC